MTENYTEEDASGAAALDSTEVTESEVEMIYLITIHEVQQGPCFLLVRPLSQAPYLLLLFQILLTAVVFKVKQTFHLYFLHRCPLIN